MLSFRGKYLRMAPPFFHDSHGIQYGIEYELSSNVLKLIVRNNLCYIILKNDHPCLLKFYRPDCNSLNYRDRIRLSAPTLILIKLTSRLHLLAGCQQIQNSLQVVVRNGALLYTGLAHGSALCKAMALTFASQGHLRYPAGGVGEAWG